MSEKHLLMKITLYLKRTVHYQASQYFFNHGVRFHNDGYMDNST